jgi:phospholipid/cholesterol/gamma-HCH transport system ATP-binding protein
MITVENLHKSFGDAHILRGVSFSLERGNTFAIVGHSGSGKSVLLRHLIGLHQPDSGRVWIDGTDITQLTDPELRSVRQRFGMLFQDGALFDSMTVFDNVAFPLRMISGTPETEVETKVTESLGRVGLSDQAEQLPAELSGGQRKRVGLARAIIRRPDYLLYDEPSSGLDPETSNTIDELITEVSTTLCRQAVMVTHNMHSVLTIADQVGFLHEGRMRFVGTVEELKKCEDPVLCEFIEANAYQL